MNKQELRESIKQEVSNSIIDMAKAWHSAKVKGRADLLDLIRTEKLKLLAEVRERVVGSLEPQNENGLLPDRVDRRNQLRTEQLEVLTKLEAEL